MKITSYARVSLLERQTFNLDLMMPVNEKLTNLYQFVVDHERKFVGLSCKDQNLIPPSSALADEAQLVTNCDPQLQEFIQVAERRSLTELKAFLHRCIDVVNFLVYVEREVSMGGRKFIDLIKSLGPEMQDALSKEEYRDFVSYDSNVIVRKLLEKLIDLESTADAKLSEQTLRAKQKKVSELCPTLFSPDESRVFLGTSML